MQANCNVFNYLSTFSELVCYLRKVHVLFLCCNCTIQKCLILYINKNSVISNISEVYLNEQWKYRQWKENTIIKRMTFKLCFRFYVFSFTLSVNVCGMRHCYRDVSKIRRYVSELGWVIKWIIEFRSDMTGYPKAQQEHDTRYKAQQGYAFTRTVKAWLKIVCRVCLWSSAVTECVRVFDMINIIFLFDVRVCVCVKTVNCFSFMK